MSNISIRQRLLFRLYDSGDGQRSLGPLTITNSATLLAIAIAWAITLLLYLSVNQFFLWKLDIGITEEGIVRPSTTGDEHCVELIGGTRDKAASRFACLLAQKAAPAKFDSSSLESYPHRAELVAHLAASLSESSDKFVLANLRRFVLDLHTVKAPADIPGGDIGDAIRSRYSGGQPPQTVTFDDAARQLITGYDPQGWPKLRMLTGLYLYEPGNKSLEEALFMPPSAAYKGALKGIREDALILTEGLIEQMRQSTFVWWRSAQAINGPIQWLTCLVAFVAIALLMIRAGFANLSVQVCNRFTKDRVVPAAILSRGKELKWVMAADVVDRLPADDRRFLPIRVLTDASQMAGPSGTIDGQLLSQAVDGYAEETSEHDYVLIRWLVDAIPTLGFLGTVYGMILAMGGAGNVVGAESQQELKFAMGELSRNLGTAFDTTCVALLLSLVVGLFLGRTKRAEADLFATIRVQAEGFLTQFRALKKDARA